MHVITSIRVYVLTCSSNRAEHAMADPEIQAILTDPIIRTVLTDFQTNPQEAQKVRYEL
jgi:hypothetical protein